MKQFRYLLLIIILNACKINDTSHNDYDIYNLMVNKLSGAENAPWLSGKDIDYGRLKGRENLKLYLKIIDSTKKEMLKRKLVLVVHDTCSDINAEMNVLKYAATKNNGSYFTNDFDGDTSFNQFIMDYKSNGIKNKVLEIKNFNTKYKFNIKKKNEVSKDETVITNITFSNIAYYKNYSKAILYASAASSGSLYFLTKIKNEWGIAHQIQLWVI